MGKVNIIMTSSISVLIVYMILFPEIEEATPITISINKPSIEQEIEVVSQTIAIEPVKVDPKLIETLKSETKPSSGPIPILSAKNQNPTQEELAAIVDNWIDDLVYFSVTNEDMQTNSDRNNILGWDQVRFVDNRMLCMIRVKGTISIEDPRIEERFDNQMFLAHCFNRFSLEYPKADHFDLMSVPRIAELEAREDHLKREFKELGVSRFGFTNSWVSSETITFLGGSQK